MSVSGKQSEIKDGDVYLETDGYMRMYFTNTDAVWFEVLFSKTNRTSWVGNPRLKPYVPDGAKHIMNVADLLFSVRDELQNEPSN
jgi:hypothetical protein